jgi:S-ribosylhomocysteine lyase LuxS involved in autoinducer biosynthesis
MTVGELKEILNDVPDEMTIEEFDELEFMFSTDGFTYFSPCGCETGVLVLTDDEENEEIIFAALPHDIDNLEIDFTETSIIHPN